MEARPASRRETQKIGANRNRRSAIRPGSPKGTAAPEATAETKGPSFSAKEMRHLFHIETLPKSGIFRRQPYLYHCIRCKWRFRVNDTKGSIVALAPDGSTLEGAEAEERIRTFAHGPCPKMLAAARQL